jgi:hypothetical protein
MVGQPAGEYEPESSRATPQTGFGGATVPGFHLGARPFQAFEEQPPSPTLTYEIQSTSNGRHCDIINNSNNGRHYNNSNNTNSNHGRHLHHNKSNNQRQFISLTPLSSNSNSYERHCNDIKNGIQYDNKKGRDNYIIIPITDN